MKNKIFATFLLLIFLFSFSLFSCTNEQAYLGKMKNLSDGYTKMEHEFATAIRDFRSGGAGDTGTVYYKELANEFIKSTHDTYKKMNELNPPSKYKKAHSYFINAMESAEKFAEYVQKTVDMNYFSEIQGELLAGSEDLQTAFDYFALAEREAAKVE